MTKAKHSAAHAATDDEPTAAIVPFNFHGDALEVATTPDGEHWVVLARLCEPFELRVDGQTEKLLAAPWAVTQKIWVTDSRGVPHETVCLNIRSIAGWLFTVNAGKVRPHLRAKLAMYQRECADVLADHFLGKRGAERAAMATFERLATALEGIQAANDRLARRMDAVEARLTVTIPANDGEGIGATAAERHILRPLRKVARLKAAAIHANDARTIRRLRLTEERSLRRELNYQMDKRQAWAKFPPERLTEAKNAIERIVGMAEDLARLAGVVSNDTSGPLFAKVADPRNVN